MNVEKLMLHQFLQQFKKQFVINLHENNFKQQRVVLTKFVNEK